MKSADEIIRNALRRVVWKSPRHGEMTMVLIGYECDFRRMRKAVPGSGKTLVLQDKAGTLYHVPMEEVEEVGEVEK